MSKLIVRWSADGHQYRTYDIPEGGNIGADSVISRSVSVFNKDGHEVACFYDVLNWELA